MPIVKVTRKYQITIPKAIREDFNINVGDMLLIRKDGDKIVIEPIVRRDKDAVEKILNIFRKSLPIDAVKLVEESWDED
ncbi:MAG: AbrB/MazE/SpoVT family DNA-binding domain-containing protein [Candidatus Njordarchaeota archaeon]